MPSTPPPRRPPPLTARPTQARSRPFGVAAAFARALAHAQAPPCAVRPLRFFAGRPDLAEATVVDVLRNDPRSVYRKAREQPDYLLCLDGIDVSCVWDNDAVRVVAARMARPAALRPRDRREAPAAASAAET